MNFNDFVYVKTIAQANNISKAAQELHISQPSLTQAVKRLESELGVKLFSRTNKGTTLTESGKDFYNTSLEIIQLYENLLDRLSNTGEEIKKLHIGTSWYVANNLILDALSTFCKAYPNIDVRIIEHSTQKLLELYENGELDAIIIHEDPKKPYNDVRYNVNVLKKERFCLVASSSLNLEKYAVKKGLFWEIDIEFIRKINIIKFRETQRIRQITDTFLKRKNIEPPVLLYVNGFENAVSLAKKGEAMAFLPKGYVENKVLKETDLKAFIVNESESLYWNICFVTKRDEVSTKARELFYELLKDM